MGFFYKAVVQAVLLYGSESWVMVGKFMARLRAFHHRVARCLTGLHGHPDPNNPDEWLYPPMEEVLAMAGFHSIETYIDRRRISVYNNYVQDSSPMWKEVQARLQADQGRNHCQRKCWWDQVQ